MNRLLSRIRRKSDIKPLPKNLSSDTSDNDKDYVLGIDKSLTYECKRLSLSYTLLSDTTKEVNNRGLTGSASMGALNTICLDKNSKNNKKTHRRRSFWTSKGKSTVIQSEGKRGWFSRLFSQSKKKEERSHSAEESDRKLHVLWYASNNVQEETMDPRVQFRHSWAQDAKKEIATSIAAELESKSKTKSLFLRNTDRLSILTETEGKEKF